MRIIATKEEVEQRATKCAKELWDYNFAGPNPALAPCNWMMPEISKADGFDEAFRKEWNRLYKEP